MVTRLGYDYEHLEAILMTKSGHILIVDDDTDILTAGNLLLKRHFAQVSTTANPTELPHLLATQRFDAILLDMNFFLEV